MAERKKQSKLKNTIRSIWPMLLAACWLLLFYNVDAVIKWVLPFTKYYYTPNFVIPHAAVFVQEYITHPLSNYFSWNEGLRWLAIPYFIFIAYLLFFAHLHVKKSYKYVVLLLMVIFGTIRLIPNSLTWLENSQPSQSFGKEEQGSISNAKRMPFSKKGYCTYSFWGYLLGRTYLHQIAKNTLIDAFKNATEKCPDREFVLGETGLKKGGPIGLHAGKQNGLQADILLPLLKDGKVDNACHLGHFWYYRTGYERKNGLKALLKNRNVDFEHLAILLLELHNAAIEHNLGLKSIEIHPKIRRELLKHEHGKELRKLLSLKGRNESKDKPAYITITFANPN
ncbi:MAG: hypothetical protein KDC92_08790 [Bacteroidetes bacterium]|nr:hypothetical protein [Bacteroidota bacterium]